MKAKILAIIPERWIYILPCIIILFSIIVFPFVYSIGMSFSLIDMATGLWTWAGLDHYKDVLTDSRFLNSVRVVGTIMAVALPIQFGWALVLALILHRGVKGKKYVIVLLLIPATIAPIAAGEIWKLVFSADYGPINYIGKALFDMQPRVWLNDPQVSIFTLVVADTWQWTPFVMMLLYAGLMTIPEELIEAAKVDGASSWQTFFRITLPLLKPIIMITMVMRGIEAFKSFELPFIMTAGGPGTATETITLYIYRTGFYFWKLPTASVMSFIMLGITTLLVTFYMRLLFRYKI